MVEVLYRLKFQSQVTIMARFVACLKMNKDEVLIIKCRERGCNLTFVVGVGKPQIGRASCRERL